MKKLLILSLLILGSLTALDPDIESPLQEAKRHIRDARFLLARVNKHRLEAESFEQLDRVEWLLNKALEAAQNKAGSLDHQAGKISNQVKLTRSKLKVLEARGLDEQLNALHLDREKAEIRPARLNGGPIRRTLFNTPRFEPYRR